MNTKYIIKNDSVFRIEYDQDDYYDDPSAMETVADCLPSIHFATSHPRYSIGQAEYEGRGFGDIMEEFFADLTGCSVYDVITQLEVVKDHLDAAGDEGFVLLSAMEFHEDPHAASTKVLQCVTPTLLTEDKVAWREELDKLVGELQDLLEGVREFWLEEADYLRATPESARDLVWRLIDRLPNRNPNIYLKELQLYEHSGTCLTVSDLGSPTPCRWDSGIVGFVYGWLHEARKDLGLPEDTTVDEVRARVDEIVKSTVHTRDLEMNGCSWIFSSEKIDLTFAEGLDLANVKARFESDPAAFFEEFASLVESSGYTRSFLCEDIEDALHYYLQDL